LGKRKRITKKGLKHDALLETAAKGSKFVEHHLSTVVIGVIAALAVVAGVTLFLRSRGANDLAASAALATATQTLNSGLTTQAAQEFEALIAEFGGTRSAGAATCYLGTVYFHEGRVDEARDLFDGYLDRYGSEGSLGIVALEGKAAVLEQQRDFLAAAAIHEALAERSADVEPSAVRYLLAALRNYRSAGDWPAVQDAAARMLEAYPDSPRAPEARVLLAEAQVHPGT